LGSGDAPGMHQSFYCFAAFAFFIIDNYQEFVFTRNKAIFNHEKFDLV
jgi:hypothetical protein